MTSDPIGLFGGTNTYGYVLGNPMSYVDSLGLDANTVHIGLNLPFIGGVEIGLVLNDGTNAGGLFGPGGGPFDIGGFITFKNPIGGFANGKSTAGVSQTLGCRSNFDGTDAEVELGLLVLGATASGVGDNTITNNSLGIELGVTAGFEAFQTHTSSFTVRDFGRLIAATVGRVNAWWNDKPFYGADLPIVGELPIDAGCACGK